MHQPARTAGALRVHPVIKRNIVLFVLSQCFIGAGMVTAYGIGPLMVIALTGSAGLAGLSVGLIGLSRFLVSYPVGKITDSYGRKPGIILGLSLALIGTLALAVSMSWRSPALLVIGMLIFGMGMNASQQMRVAATDMFPPQLRGQALGFVALGALVGIMLSPLLIVAGEVVARPLGQDPLGTPWLLLPVLIVAGMALVAFVHPDPKEIGLNLARYYPGHVQPSPSSPDAFARFSVSRLLRGGRTSLAIVSNSAAQGNMAIVMVLTSLVLAHHGHSLTEIAFSHAFHAAGMFAFTIPLGRLADRIGRAVVMFPGVATTLVGAWLVTFAPGFWPITLGTFLVGLGWAAANVAATALIADQVETAERGRAIGVNDTFAGAMAVLAAAVTGPLIEWSGLPAAGLTAVLVALVPLLMLVASKWREVHAGR
jgi:MFS family permease